MEWTEDLLKELSERRKSDSYGTLASELTSRYGDFYTGEQVRSALRRYAARINTERERSYRQISVPSKPRAFDKPLRIVEDTVSVVSDLHAPYHSPEMINRMLTISQGFNSKHLVIAGDLFNFDSVSNWGNPAGETFKDELKSAGDLLMQMSDYFESITICNGNHDERLARKLDANVSTEDLVLMALGRHIPNCVIQTTDYDYLFAEIAGRPWAFGHLSGYNRRPGEVAKQLANKYQCNVAVGHDHIQGYTSTEDGRWLCMSMGSMLDIDNEGMSSLWYKERRFNNYAPFVNGFLVVSQGVPYLFNKNGSSSLNGGMDWSYWRM